MMVRVIKFRIWNNNGQCMHGWRELVDKNKIHLLADQQGAYPVMQFTGLTDKNGVEIYEGDIIQDQFGKSAVVKWFESEAGFELLDIEEVTMNGIDTEEPAYIIDTSDGWVVLSVIGNIYQNPELIQ